MKRLGYATYQDYLASPHWRRFRKRYRASRPWRCICGETKRLQLHHVTYDRLGAEELDDVRPLCQGCHAVVHQLEAEGQSGLNPDHLFFQGRAAIYARTRPDLLAEQPKRLSDMTPEERRAHNRAIRSGDVKPRDWRSERALPRKRT